MTIATPAERAKRIHDRMLRRAHSAYQMRKGRKFCLKDNECLECDGGCVGYRQTAVRMRSLRDAYRERQAVLRAKRDARDAKRRKRAKC